MSREAWLASTDELLLADCEVDTYRASGPGGQKRNKTASAIRLRHSPSGVVTRATDTRSQHKNKALALARLRVAIAVEVREPSVELEDSVTEAVRVMVKRGRPGELEVIAGLLDMLADAKMSLKVVGEQLDLTSAAVAKTLRNHPEARRWVNQERSKLELGPLR